MQKITPCLWFNNNAEEAMSFYVSTFKKSQVLKISRYGEEAPMPKGTVMMVTFKINGLEVMGLNVGVPPKSSPAVSFFVYSTNPKEVDEYYEKLSAGGKVMMPLDKYPFSERYAFITDKFGVAWQLMLVPKPAVMAPCLLFVDTSLGKAKSAVEFYTKAFKKAKVNHMMLYEKGEGSKVGSVKHASFNLEGQEFTAMDGPGPHQFIFTDAISFVINCEGQKEVDYFWDLLSKGGKKSQCGWLSDKYGVTWQVTPAILLKLITDKNPEKAKRVMQAMMKMQKIEIKPLQEASDSVQVVKKVVVAKWKSVEKKPKR
jgi:predicted 3-demethylubiquinone-9 3-methyltransferase (glyoxalase superfamily)